MFILENTLFVLAPGSTSLIFNATHTSASLPAKHVKFGTVPIKPHDPVACRIMPEQAFLTKLVNKPWNTSFCDVDTGRMEVLETHHTKSLRVATYRCNTNRILRTISNVVEILL